MGPDPRARAPHPAEDRALREGGWQHTVGLELAGLTLGVIGLGRLGSQVARIGEAFGMDVIAWSQNLATPLTKEELLRAFRRRHDPRAAERAHARADRCRRARADEADRVADQHVARPDRRRGRARSPPSRAARSPAPVLMSTTRSRCRRPPAAPRAQHRPHAAPRLRHRRELHGVLQRRRRGHRRVPARRAHTRDQSISRLPSRQIASRHITSANASSNATCPRSASARSRARPRRAPAARSGRAG